jgi:hypothetical protein
MGVRSFAVSSCGGCQLRVPALVAISGRERTFEYGNLLLGLR